MNFFAFDSFEGLPEVTSSEKKSSVYSAGMYAFSLDSFNKNLKINNVDQTKVFPIKGWYDKVLTKNLVSSINISEAAIIFIDCNLYSSTVSVLNFITPFLQNGTIIIFDDWFCFRSDPNEGGQKAFSEWLSNNPQISVSEWLKFNEIGNSFIIHKK
jgi:hypothetical protein